MLNTLRFISILLIMSLALCCQLSAEQRIAVAGGSITEIIYHLGKQDNIVAVDSTSTFPSDTSKYPILGYVRNIAAEGVLSLEPDLLIGEPDTGPTKTLKQLKATGLKTIILEDDNTLTGIKDKIRTVAELVNAEAEGETLLMYIDKDLQALSYAKERLEGKTKPNILFLLSIRNGSPIAAGHTTSANTAIIESGGHNVLADQKGWIKLSTEASLALKPDAIVIMSNHTESIINEVKNLPHFSITPAAKNDAIYTIDGSYLLGFGPRTPQAIVELGTMINPDFELPEGYVFRQKNKSADSLPNKGSH